MLAQAAFGGALREAQRGSKCDEAVCSAGNHGGGACKVSVVVNCGSYKAFRGKLLLEWLEHAEGVDDVEDCAEDRVALDPTCSARDGVELAR